VGNLLGNEKFEQFEDDNTDTVIYGLNKMIGLLLNFNPNCVELLGCKPEHYFILSDEGKQLIANRKIFLSRKCIKTFGSYANNQLRRLQ
ncbi:MAG TPA: nucleotidyltransferase, partial [Lachnospiraceae bacterium]|nr:nucleotidyltransferase [Lachnospiraceae bacterium]